MSSIVIAPNGSFTEIYTGANFDAYWIALRFSPDTGGYEEVFVSPSFVGPNGTDPRIVRIVVANVIGGSGNEIVVGISDGRILVYDQATKALLDTIHSGIANIADIAVADIDPGVGNEIVAVAPAGTFVMTGAGVFRWTVVSAVGTNMVVAQMDNDAALEIALSSGMVVDGVSRTVQWNRAGGFGFNVEAADIDSDGRSEIVSGTSDDNLIRAFDVELQTMKWSLPAYIDVAGVTLADTDGDTVPEVIYGERQWGSIFVHDAVSLVQEAALNNPEHGVTNIVVGDADADGDRDIVWGAGYSSSGPDHLYVVDWTSRATIWQNDDLVGPLIGPVVGDLDGNGTPELVVVSSLSNAGFNAGRILVFDARTRRQLAMSGFIANDGWGGTTDIRLRNVDTDGGLEILVSALSTNNGTLEVYDFNGLTREIVQVFESSPTTLPPFYAIEAGDIDGDGTIEVLGGTGGWIYVFHFELGGVEWGTVYLGPSTFTDLELAELDGDAGIEIVGVLEAQRIFVVDGLTRQVEAELYGEFTALSLGTTGTGAPSILAGTSGGEVVTFAHVATPGPSPYEEVSRETYVPGQVDGVRMDSRGRLWIVTNGNLVAFDVAGNLLWSPGPGYGASFGPNVAFLPNSNVFFGATAVGVFAFASGTGFGSGKPGVQVASTSTRFLRNTLTPGPADAAFTFGAPGSGLVPLTGDWNGDDIDAPGLYDPASGAFFLKNSNASGGADGVFGYGPAGAGWMPVVGDWDGDGADSIGLFDPSTGVFFLRNSNSAGPANAVFGFGPPSSGWQPIAGDWNGDGVDTIGLFNPTGSVFFLRNSNAPGAADLTFGYGPAGSGWKPVVGDWDSDGSDSIGLYSPASGFFFLRMVNASGGADLVFGFGPAGAIPVVGDWTGP